MENRLDKNDYSKLRVPIVFVSLCIVIYLSVVRKRSQGENLDEKCQEDLEGEDKKFE